MEVERERKREKIYFPRKGKNLFEGETFFHGPKEEKAREREDPKRFFFSSFFLFPRRENHGSFLSRETYRLENSLIGHGSTDTGYRRLSGWRMRSAFKTVFQRYVGILSRGKCAACKNIPRCSSFLRDGERHSMPRVLNVP